MTELDDVPRTYLLFKPLLDALRSLGGSGTIQEIEERFIELGNISDEMLDFKRPGAHKSELLYRLAWARSSLKVFGVLDNSTRGVWSLTPKAQDYVDFDPEKIRASVRAARLARKKARRKEGSGNLNVVDDENDVSMESDNQSWRDDVITTILEKMSPQGFEKLIQRVLRESGFTQVEVTGRTGDNGIDGKGIAKIHGIMSFHVVFQAKRYSGTVGSPQIRDFRGAMVGKADKGLFVTTGTFTKEARSEAQRDGAPPIDLIDGEEFAEKLKELELGVSTRTIEEVDVHKEWFEDLEAG